MEDSPRTRMLVMKRKKQLIVFLYALILLACSKEESPLPAEGEEARTVGFSVSADEMVTRADAALLATGTIPAGKSFGVYAYYHDDSRWEEAAEPNFMFNQQVTKDATEDLYTYSPLKYWPNEEDDKLSFIGYYPYTPYPVAAPYDAEAAQPTTGIKPQLANTGAGLSAYRFRVKDDVAEQVDFMVSDLEKDLPVSRSLDENPGLPFNNLRVTDKVPLFFRHMTSKIEVSIVVDEDIRTDFYHYTIHSIQLENVLSEGVLTPTYDMTEGKTEFAWSDHSRRQTFNPVIFPTYNTADNATIDVSVATPAITSEAYLLLPQVLGDDVRMTLSYDLMLKSQTTGKVYTYDNDGNLVEVDPAHYTYGNHSVSVQLNTLDLKEWEYNHCYTYLIRLGAHRIEFNAEVVGWGEYHWQPL